MMGTKARKNFEIADKITMLSSQLEVARRDYGELNMKYNNAISAQQTADRKLSEARGTARFMREQIVTLEQQVQALQEEVRMLKSALIGQTAISSAFVTDVVELRRRNHWHESRDFRENHDWTPPSGGKLYGKDR